MSYQIVRQDASGPTVVATVPHRHFSAMIALAQSDITMGAAIIGLRLNLKDKSALKAGFTVRFDESGYIEYKSDTGGDILWYFHEVDNVS